MFLFLLLFFAPIKNIHLRCDLRRVSIWILGRVFVYKEERVTNIYCHGGQKTSGPITKASPASLKSLIDLLIHLSFFIIFLLDTCVLYWKHMGRDILACLLTMVYHKEKKITDKWRGGIE